ncbi:MAG TPA: HAD family phosphatase [Candidatus Nanopelagicales bacterium]|nr:HAD family phosphatase [Candidatus Nanopelagicales bacterium]
MTTTTHLPAAVLFDMDGTLIDSEHLWLAAEINVMNDLGATWTSADQTHCLGGPLERVAAYMAERSGSDRAIAQIGEALLNSIEHQMRTSPLSWRPGAAQLLGSCLADSIPRVLVTASWARLVDALSDRIAQEFGGDPFTSVVAGDHVRNSKPHPEPYVMAAARVGSDPKHCLAIEDSPTGVRSAIAAGCKVIAVPHLAPVDGLVSSAPHAAVVTSLEGWSVQALWELVG